MKALTLRDKFRGCLIGAAIGDALGMPVETLNHLQIALTTEGKGVQGYLKPIQKKIADTRDLPPGSTTDDTQLMLAVCHSLIDCRRFSLVDQARKLIEAGINSPFNYGRATKRGMDEIAPWFATEGARGRNPEAHVAAPSSEGEGCGNGVAMKVEPLALYHAAVYGTNRVDPLLDDVMSLGLMTHGDPRASISAYATSVIIGAAFAGEPMGIEDVIGLVMLAEKRYRFFRKSGRDFSSALLGAREHLASAEGLRDNVGTGGICLESVAFSIATFFRHPADFRTGVLEAVNAGGDADTTASMVGGMIGANVGLSGIPQDLVDGLSCRRRLMMAADDLADVIEDL
jgi:ADP-ribosylglycohydrolase